MSISSQYADNEAEAARLILAHTYVLDLIEGSFDQAAWKGRLDRDGIWDATLQIRNAHEAAIEKIAEQMRYAKALAEVSALAERTLPDDNRSTP